ncbi:uncharacterized protein LOC143852704 isoform X1 [Tasmannia lanceolata]|uniref:uncharacterized protein LOC143852704 isoform X1 n=1 Tax=Tasmannia lanceolata TaxID=3420 RepID=UPI0040631703
MLKSFTSSAIQLGMTFIGENITNLPEDNLPFLERIRENSIGPSEDFGVYSKMHCWRAPKFPNRKERGSATGIGSGKGDMFQEGRACHWSRNDNFLAGCARVIGQKEKTIVGWSLDS